MSTAVFATGITSLTYSSGVPSTDIAEIDYYDVRNMAGLAYWGRADSAVDNIGSGYKAQMADKRTGSSRLLRQPTGQTGVFVKSTTEGYLRNRATLLGDTATDGYLGLSENIMPTSGAWAIYMAINPITGGYKRLFGNSSGSGLEANIVSTQIRLQVTSGTGASVTATPSGGIDGRDFLIGFFRRTDSTSTRLAIRYKTAGAAWVDAPATDYCTSNGLVGGAARTISADLRVGCYATTASYYANWRLAQIMIFNADVGTSTLRDKIEEYLSNYHGMS